MSCLLFSICISLTCVLTPSFQLHQAFPLLPLLVEYFKMYLRQTFSSSGSIKRSSTPTSPFISALLSRSFFHCSHLFLSSCPNPLFGESKGLRFHKFSIEATRGNITKLSDHRREETSTSVTSSTIRTRARTTLTIRPVFKLLQEVTQERSPQLSKSLH